MKKTINILMGLLAFQICLGVMFFLQNEPTATFKAKDPFFSFKKDELNKVIISDKKENSKTIELVKQDGQWVIPSYYQFPVSASKMNDFLDKMLQAKKSWPVGNTEISAKQFKVTEENFEKKISFYNGEKLENTLYLGNSPSFKKLHARVDQDPLTYTINFGTHEASLEASEWMDKSHLKLERSKVEKISLSGIDLKNNGGNFIVEEIPANKETDMTEANMLVSRLINPQFEAVLGLKGDVKHGEKLYEYTTILKDDKKIVYTYFKDPTSEAIASKLAEKDGAKNDKKAIKLVLTTSGSPFAYSASNESVAAIKEKNKDSLLRDKPEEKEKNIQGEASLLEGNSGQPNEKQG